MALFTTDWTNELEQVNISLKTLLHEEVEPMVDKALDRSVAEMEQTLNKASFEVQVTIKQLSVEIDRQRILMVAELRKMIVLFSLSMLCVGVAVVLLSHFL